MGRMSWSERVGRLIEILLVLALLAGPFWLLIQFPQAATQIAAMHATLVPWVIVLVVLLIFRTSLQAFLSGIAEALGRLRSIGAGSTRADFDQGSGSLPIGTESGQNEALYWYLRYVAVTIYGSQVAALQAISSAGPMSRENLIQFYSQYLAKGGDRSYVFESWLRYLVDSKLLTMGASGAFELTQGGQAFVAAAKSAGVTPDTFHF